MRLKSDLILLLTAAIWGSGFVAQRQAASANLNPLYFNGSRFLLAVLILLPLTRFQFSLKRRDLPWVAAAGTLLFLASGLQQAGLSTTSISNASFITGLYVILIPLILFLVWREKIDRLTLIAALMATAGVALLSLQDEFKIAPGDGLELLGAGMWALHVILVGWLSRRMQTLQLALGQFAVCGLLNFFTGALTDLPGMGIITESWMAILYSALFPVAMGFTLQLVGQKNAPPVDAAIILSLEAVFGALFGFLMMGETLTLRQMGGCALMLGAMILSQLNPGKTVEPEPLEPAPALEEV